MRRHLVLCFLVVASTASAAEPVTALRFGKLIDGRGGVVADPVIIVRGNRIERIARADEPLPAGATSIDLRRYTAIPGLIDAHTHMTFYWDRSPGTTPWAQLGSLGPAVTVFLAQENARRTLQSGVTTVRDLGSWESTDLAMRDLINRGAMAGPRMFVAGSGLHVSSGVPRTGSIAPPGQCDSVAECQRVVRQQIGSGVDWIKMYGSTGSDQDVTGFQTFSFEEMKAAADCAHRAGKRIAIHSYGPDGARDAARAGADSIEHATDMDDATIQEMARRRIVYVPTVEHNRYYIEHRTEFGYDDAVVKRLEEYVQRNLATLRKAIKAGVPIAMGSDAVFTGFGENARELERFVEAGMTPADALRSATTVGASLLGMSDTLGAIAPGYFADIVAVDGDPHADIRAVTRRVMWVMKDGQVVMSSAPTYATYDARTRNPAPALIALMVASMVACTSTRPEPCGEPPHLGAPRNFGRVAAADGHPTAIYRGGQPMSCGELQYLRSLGVKSILKLNDRGLPVDMAEKTQAVELGLQIKSFPFSASTIGRPATCGSVREALTFLENPDNWPVYVHCTAGKDRTGYVVGMYEKLVLGKPATAVMAELHNYGHRGVRSLLMPQIDRELASDGPACK